MRGRKRDWVNKPAIAVEALGTTLRLPRHDIGAGSAWMLFDRIPGRGRESEVLLRPELIVRESTPQDQL